MVDVRNDCLSARNGVYAVGVCGGMPCLEFLLCVSDGSLMISTHRVQGTHLLLTLCRLQTTDTTIPQTTARFS